jgi:nicotinamide mononucleotide transporter
MSFFEWVGVAFGLISVYLTVRQSVWCWPTGIISVVAFAILFFQIKLYVDVGLQVFFTVTSLQGWYYWLYGGQNKTELPISFLTRKQIAVLALALALCVLVIGYVFDTYTDAHIPFWDATASGLSVVAQILLMRKKFENWYLWIAVDVLSIGIYLYKEVYLTAGLYLVFLILAIGGLLAWRNSLKLASSSANSYL